MMKGQILVTGSEGLVGSRFIEIFPRKNDLHLPRQIEFDITDEVQIKALMASYNFSAVINFAAYTDVSGAEKQKGDKNGDCWKVNVDGVRKLVSAIDPLKTHFIQISTDMVFTGSSNDPGPYPEYHPVESDSNKLTWYGYAKAQAEKAVRDKLGDNATIIRLIYPVRAHFKERSDYVRKIIDLYDEGKLYPMFTDQQVSITFVDDVSRSIDKILTDNKRGIFHIGSKDTTTPFEIALYLLERTREGDISVESTTLAAFLKGKEDSIRYPKHGGLNVEITQKKLGIEFDGWRQIIDKLVNQGLGQKE